MRKYDLKCPVARSLDVIGDRWSLLILRDFFRFGARRFQDFEQTLPRLAPSILSARLKELESEGVIESHLYTDHPPRLEYSLTQKGRDLGPILSALKAWGERYAGRAPAK
jgi:DNA-binding HxlR family transcriptional regulator